MTTSFTDRNRAVQLSRSIVADSSPRSFDESEVVLICTVLLEAAEAFRTRYAPVYYSALAAFDGTGYDRWEERLHFQREVARCRQWHEEQGKR